MNREKLLKNMTDQVKEAQLKLGYAKETVRLYYPVDSLNTILGSNAKDDQEMLTLLRKAFEAKSSLGELHFYSHAGRVEISVSMTSDDPLLTGLCISIYDALKNLIYSSVTAALTQSFAFN